MKPYSIEAKLIVASLFILLRPLALEYSSYAISTIGSYVVAACIFLIQDRAVDDEDVKLTLFPIFYSHGACITVLYVEGVPVIPYFIISIAGLGLLGALALVGSVIFRIAWWTTSHIGNWVMQMHSHRQATNKGEGNDEVL